MQKAVAVEVAVAVAAAAAAAVAVPKSVKNTQTPQPHTRLYTHPLMALPTAPEVVNVLLMLEHEMQRVAENTRVMLKKKKTTNKKMEKTIRLCEKTRNKVCMCFILIR